MPLNVYITAWEADHTITAPTGQQFTQYGPDMRDSVRNVAMGLCDIVGRLIVKPDTGERGVILEGNDGVFAKNRLDSRKGCKVDELFNFQK
jgi:phage nucleotide-binding protein